MEKVKTLLDEFECQVPVSFEDSTGRLLVEFLSSRLLNRQELDDFMMVRVELMCLPEHLIAFIDLINAPEQLSFQNEDFNVVRVFLRSVFQLSECKVLVGSSDVGESFEIDELNVVRLNSRD